MKRLFFAFGTFALLAASCSSWSSSERELINADGDVMRVLTVDNPEDTLVLRTPCTDFTVRELKSKTFHRLAEKMIATVTSPEQDGVGIAGPQVGIGRRVVAVQRYDKPGKPFEVYPNLRIIGHSGKRQLGPEGCLSVPGRRGMVRRYQRVDITYTSLYSFKDTTETVNGYTAVIFQHEADHLDGVLYTDRNPYPAVSLKTASGASVNVIMLHHGSVAISYGDYMIQVDPVAEHGGVKVDYSLFPKPDLILVTHDHGDHLDKATISSLSLEKTELIQSLSAFKKYPYGSMLQNLKFFQLPRNIGLSTIPAYNVTPEHKQFHERGQGNGYVLDIDGVKIYISGDTEDIPEMMYVAAMNVDLALLSVNQPYTMTPEQCVHAASMIAPKILVPYHLGDTDMQSIKDTLDARNSGIEVLLFEELR
ncbi:MAG: peptide deformylase [Bacteroidaceae bacterium]|nr:peptide deformylase [Bacteroidaceae bacterium]